MMLRAASIVALLSAPAAAQSYLVQPDLATAQARSQAQCVAVHCDGVFTRFWWPVQPLSDGSAALVIQPNGPYAASATINGKVGALTGPEVSTLRSAAQIAPLLPVAAAPALQAVPK